jgi:hypothetical protein
MEAVSFVSLASMSAAWSLDMPTESRRLKVSIPHEAHEAHEAQEA